MVVEAVQFNGSNWEEVQTFLRPDERDLLKEENIPEGDWLVRRTDGNLLRYKPDVFSAKFEEALPYEEAAQ